MSRRRINNSKRRREWRKARAEELAELRALWVDAVYAHRAWTRRLRHNYTDIEYQNDFLRRLFVRQERRWNDYQTALNDR